MTQTLTGDFPLESREYQSPRKTQLIVAAIVAIAALVASIITGGMGFNLVAGGLAGGAIGMAMIGLLILLVMTKEPLITFYKIPAPPCDLSKIIQMTSLDEAMIRAEILKATNIAEHDLPKEFFAVIHEDGAYFLYLQKEDQENFKGHIHHTIHYLAKDSNELASRCVSELRHLNAQKALDILEFFKNSSLTNQ